MVVDDAHLCAAFTAKHADRHIQNKLRLCGADLDGRCFQVLSQPALVLIRHMGNNLKSRAVVPGNDPHGSGCLNAPASVGIGYDHTFYILDDIPTGLDLHPLRQTAQGLSGNGRAVGHRNRLGTAQRRDQLLAEDLEIGTVFFTVSFHVRLLFPVFRELCSYCIMICRCFTTAKPYYLNFVMP